MMTNGQTQFHSHIGF